MSSPWSWIQSFGDVTPWIVLGAAAAVFPLLFFVTAPYGRHFRAGWGPAMSSRAGWIAMEWPSVLVFALVWMANPSFDTPLVRALGVLWLVHYVQRTFVFSLLLRDSGKRQAVLTVGAGARRSTWSTPPGTPSALRRPALRPAFVVGAALFAIGFLTNVHSDHVLRTLRAPGESGYRVPFGGGFRYVSAPNYLGEIVEWIGFALAAQTLAAWAFAAFTFANLAPRAVANHRWYRERFPEYPGDRRALIPFLW